MTNRKVFLSHSSRDKNQVRRLALALQEAGVAVWLDEWEILVGDSITQKMQAGINECGFLAVWVTQHAINSRWVEKEWQAKFNQEVETGSIAVLPLLAEPCELPGFLRDKKFADFRADFQQGLEELLRVFHQPGIAAAHCEPDDSGGLHLEYFNIDSQFGSFERTSVTAGEYELKKWLMSEAKSRAVQRRSGGQESLEICPIDRIWMPGTPCFKRCERHPVFLLTVYNGEKRKIVLHTLELEVVNVDEYKGFGDTHTLAVLAIFDIEVPTIVGTVSTPMKPQIVVAAGDIASFNVRLLPPSSNAERTLKDFSLNLRVIGSNDAAAESGVFHIDLLT